MVRWIKYVQAKINSKLTNQLTIALLGMFMLIISISSISLYILISNIIQSNYKDVTLAQLKQYEYNINAFCNNIDLISRQLINDAGLYNLLNYSNMSLEQRVNCKSITFNKLNQARYNFPYIDSIIYYDSDGLVLRSSSNENSAQYDDVNIHKFSSSYINWANENFSQKLQWISGYSNSDFGLNLGNGDVKPVVKYYLSAARSIFSAKVQGMLIINLDMDYFTSIYNYSNNVKGSDLFLINSNGVIISDLDEKLIGKTIPFYNEINIDENHGFLTEKTGKAPKQVFFYKLASMSWTLIKEQPLDVMNKDISYLQYNIFSIFIISLILASLLTRYWIIKITDPLKRLANTMIEMGQGKLGLTIDEKAKNEIGILIKHFNDMSININELMLQNSKIGEQKRRIEMEALRSQINPHFIYNSLNTIKWMAIIINADNIAESIAALSNFLQPIFKTPKIVCTLDEEITYIKNYIKIMNYRFANRFILNVDIPQNLSKCLVLQFILQPIVENSIAHGFQNKSNGIIYINACRKSDDLLITVEDNGEGIEDTQLKEINESLALCYKLDEKSNDKIGLLNVNKRIKLHFGDIYGIQIFHIKPSGVGVNFKIPYST